MKKGKIFKTLAVFTACLGAPLLLTGCKTEDEFNFRVEGEYIQWTEDGKTWTNLVELDDIQGPQGVAGKQVEFQKTSTHIQWRYVGDATWNNLVSLEDISGEDLITKSYNIEYDYNTTLDVSSLFNNYQTTQTVNSNEWLRNIPSLKNGNAENYFLGWYIEGIDKKITDYDFIGGDVKLVAKWQKYNYCQLLIEDNPDFEVGCDSFEYSEELDGYICTIDVQNPIIIVPDRYNDNINGEKDVKQINTISAGYSSSYGSNLKHIELPSNVQILGDYVFYGCENLSEINLPNSITTFSYKCFDRCKSLTEITIPESLTTVGNWAYHDCDNLTKVNITNLFTWCNIQVLKYPDVEYYHVSPLANGATLYLNGEEISGDLVIPNGVERISQYAFFNQDIISVNIPASVITIDNSAFQGCKLLERVNFEKDSNLLTINDYAFGGCNKLKMMTLPQKLTTIGYCSLTCENLKIVIPISVTRIHYGAFYFISNKQSTLFYCGNSDQWQVIDIHESLDEILVQYYIENEEDVPNDGGNYWHYDIDCKTPVIWELTTEE